MRQGWVTGPDFFFFPLPAFRPTVGAPTRRRAATYHRIDYSATDGLAAGGGDTRKSRFLQHHGERNSRDVVVIEPTRLYPIGTKSGRVECRVASLKYALRYNARIIRPLSAVE